MVHILAAFVLVVRLAGAIDESPRNYDLPAGLAGRTLKMFAQQANREIVFSQANVGATRTNAVRGMYTARAALAQMLAATGLVSSVDSASGVFAVRPEDPPAKKDDRVVEAARAPSRPSINDEAVLLTPFEVTASSDMGYEATETLAGSRLNTQLKDVATQVNVMTKEFLDDLAITTLDDAMQYSLNTENRFESFDASDINATGLNDSLFVVGSGQGGRTRGLSASNNSHDFFDTFVRQDSYNTERFTFAHGPNSILFGNSSPAGTIDTTLKRARPQRQSLEVSTRANVSTGSVRGSIGINQPIIKNKLAFRVDGLTDREKNWRKPAFYNQDRLYAALTYSPVRWFSLRAYNESANYRQQPVKNTLAQDHVTPWIAAGRPLYDNALGRTLPNAAALLAPPYNASLRLPNAAVRPILRYDASGWLGVPIAGTNNSALGSGYEDITPAPNNFKRSVTDPGIYPFDRSFNGELSQAKYRSWIRGGIVELNPLKNFFIEGGFNQEGMFSRGIEFMDGRAQELNVDPNLYLPDRVTANPNVGQFYFEDGVGGVNNRAVKGHSRKQQERLSFSYELNFDERKNWTRWLGLHRAAVLLDRLESTLVREESVLTVSPFAVTPVAGSPYAFVVGGNQNSLRPGFRYIDPSGGDYTIKLPFDPMRDGTYTQPGWVDANGREVSLMTFDPNGGQITSPSVARNKVESSALASQSYLFGRRLVLSYGRRRDSVDIYNDPSPVADWNFDRLVDSGINWQLVRNEVPVKTAKGAVLHPLSWLSLAYSETNSQQVRTEVIRNPDGTIAPTGAGIGKDYGITLRWKNRFSVRINRYENSGLGNVSGVANAVTATAAAGNLGPNFKQTIGALERGIQVNAPDFDPARPDAVPRSTLSDRFAYYQQDLARVTRIDQVIGNEIGGRYSILSDSVAKGYELTLTANPTSNWRVSVTGARNTASESNIGGQWWDLITERLPIWGAAANLAGGSTPGTTLNRAGLPSNVVASTTGSGNTNNYRTYTDVLAAAMANWNFIRMSENRLNNNLRKYRFTATTRYAFSHGGLKGIFVGANYAWRSAAAVGYPVTTSTSNPFAIPGVNPGAVTTSDISRPYRGGALVSFDGFAGYTRRFGDGKYVWRVQLNIRNLLNRDGLLVQRVLTDGTGAIYTVQEPRSFIVTNTFSF